ncbi:MAG: aminoacyl-tRNA hydrolase [bacterium]|nr:aminoacyl-tRNA hydrolase [bacterium]
MKLIVGLGNPGPKYAGTRHNAGFRVVHQLAQKYGIAVSMHSHQSIIGRGKIVGQNVYLQQPLTYMNLSGSAVKAAMTSFNIEPSDLLVISDDLDLPLGTIRVRDSGGSGGHNGLKSIIGCLDTNDFPRVRIGIGRPAEDEQVESYVLQNWSAKEKEIFNTVVEMAIEAVEVILEKGIVEAANKYNGK